MFRLDRLTRRWWLCVHVQSGAVKLVLWRHWVHVAQVHPVTSENQFRCTRLYMYVQQSDYFNGRHFCRYLYLNLRYFQIAKKKSKIVHRPANNSNKIGFQPTVGAIIGRVGELKTFSLPWPSVIRWKWHSSKNHLRSALVGCSCDSGHSNHTAHKSWLCAFNLSVFVEEKAHKKTCKSHLWAHEKHLHSTFYTR